MSERGDRSTDDLAYRYRLLRHVLAANSVLLEGMAELADDLEHFEPTHPLIQRSVVRLLDQSLLLAEDLNVLTGDGHRGLYEAHCDVEKALRSFLDAPPAPDGPLLLDLDDAGRSRLAEVGGKAAHLGELRRLDPDLVPPGFVLTTAAYRRLLVANCLTEPIRELLRDIGVLTGRDLFGQRTGAIRARIAASRLPGEVEDAIVRGLAGLSGGGTVAVRSSAVGEDGPASFAGQLATELEVEREDVAGAYLRVVAGRFADRAVLYRLLGGFTEVGTPLAVLVQPMLEAQAAGVLYTRDPRGGGGETMLASAVAGLADGLVQGEVSGQTLVLDRERPGALVAADEGDGGAAALLSEESRRRLVEVGLAVEAHFAGSQDIEWVLTREGRIVVVQARPLAVGEPEAVTEPVTGVAPLLSNGITLSPGRAVGQAYVAASAVELAATPEGAVLVVSNATPDVATVLPRIAGLVVETGSPAGHAATLIRELGVPAVVGIAGATKLVPGGETVSLDAGGRALYPGALWPPETVSRRRGLLRRTGARPGDALHERILALNLVDPGARAFRPKGCRSVHDIVRYAHERAVAAMFSMGDAVAHAGPRMVFRLKTAVPLFLRVLDLGGAVGEGTRDRREVAPEEIASAPFAALWRGVADPRVSWAGRTQVDLGGFASVVGGALTSSGGGQRELGAVNYVIVAPDYVNLNARLAYHFAMVDALLAEGVDSFVNFRFRGGGAGADRRDLRARFLAEVLAAGGYSVDRRGDLVTAWLRHRPRGTCEAGLELLGRLMACARQLDMLMADEEALHHWVERFMAKDFAAFQ